MTNVLNNIDCVPSNVQSSHQEALLYVFEDNEAVIKVIIKGRSPTMRHVSRTDRVALDWLFDRISLYSKNPNQIHRHQKPTCRHSDQRKITHVMSGIICCACSISAISVLQCALKRWQKDLQHDSGEERVTAKSRPMMSLIARASSNISSSTSESPEKRSYGNQNAWSAKAEREEANGVDPLWAATQKPRLTTIIMNNSIESFFLSTLHKVG